MLSKLVRQAIALLSGYASKVAELEANVAALVVQLAEAKAAAAESVHPAVLKSAQPKNLRLLLIR